MSGSVDLITMKTLVEAYEKELVRVQKDLAEIPDASGTPEVQQALMTAKTAASVKIVEVCGKLLDSYREYTKELEKLVQDYKNPPKVG
ncbi:MAG: hypothetical protein ABSF83_03835 [Nitrososphaerales archaeon]|jgi:hypothetical protein